MKQNPEDAELILKAQAGDERAMEQVIAHYLWLVRYLSKKYFTTGGTDEDLIQEGCLGVCKAVRDFDPTKTKNVLSYISMCVDSCLKDAVRAATRNKHKNLNDAVSLTALDEKSDALPDEYIVDPVHDYIEREQTENFYKTITKLGPDFYVRILRCYLEGYSYAEIAEETGVTAKKVDNVIFRIKKLIKENKDLFEE